MAEGVDQVRNNKVDIALLQRDVVSLQKDIAELQKETALLQRETALIQKDSAVVLQDVVYIKGQVTSINKCLIEKYITKEAFEPIRRLVYGMVGLILVAVVMGVLSLVLK
jgi:hypothetical protein